MDIWSLLIGLVGLGLAFISIFLPHMGINISQPIAWSGSIIGILFILWAIVIAVWGHQRIPTGPVLLFIAGFAAIVGSVAWHTSTKESAIKAKMPLIRDSGQFAYQTRAEIYERFMQEKTRRANIFGESAIWNMAINGFQGQLKVPSIRNNPAISQELNQELNKRIEQIEQLNKELNKEDEEYNKLIASVQIHFSDSPKLKELIKSTMRPITITIDEPGALDGKAVQKWYKEQNDSINKQLDDKVNKPLDDLANYLKENIK